MIPDTNIELHISGKKGLEELSRENFDIKDLKVVLENVDKMFASGNKSATVSLVSIDDGCAKLTFKSTKQAIVQLAALFPLMSSEPHLTNVDSDAAGAMENIQKESIKTGYTYRFVTPNGIELTISPETKYERLTPTWVEGEFYFYGEIEAAGGASDVNIHIRTKELGLLTIDTDKQYIATQEQNLLYHSCGVRATGRQNLVTGDIDKSSLKLVELIDYNPAYDEEYMATIRHRVGSRWKGVDIDNYLKEIRGYV